MNRYISLVLAITSPLALIAGGEPAQASDQKSPDQYVCHAAISKSNENKLLSFQAELRAMVMGKKRVCFMITEEDLEKLTAQERELIQKHNLKIIYGEDVNSGWVDYIQHAKETLWKKIKLACVRRCFPRDLLPNRSIIIYREEAKDRAFALKEYCDKNKQNDRENAYLIGKLLDYPEDDIECFYEHNRGTIENGFGKDFRMVLKEHRKEAQEFFVARNLEL